MTNNYAFRFFRVGDDGVLCSPLSRQPLVWERRMNTPVCTNEKPCTTVPGPCGGCGYTVVFDAAGLSLMLRYLQGNGSFRHSTPVVARVKVRGPVAAARYQTRWSRSFGTEFRAGDVEFDHLFTDDSDVVPSLASRYGVPVRVGITLANLTAPTH